MAWWASDRLAAWLQHSTDGMPAITVSCSTGVGYKYPVII